MCLSPREFEIAEQIALGATKKEVADKMHRSTYTIETTIKNVYAKLGINKLPDLVLWYCGEKFDLSIQISELKRQILATALLLIIAIHGYSDDQYRVRRYRRANETEYSYPIDNPIEA